MSKLSSGLVFIRVTEAGPVLSSDPQDIFPLAMMPLYYNSVLLVRIACARSFTTGHILRRHGAPARGNLLLPWSIAGLQSWAMLPTHSHARPFLSLAIFPTQSPPP